MNMIYNASAGTGKTWQVTELYSALVLGASHEQLPAGRGPVDASKILLMTFTDNAASELRQRVGDKMMSAEQNALADDDAETADSARRVLRSLPAAHISTIHAFCAGLLREYALDCGLSATFETLEDEARSQLFDEVLREELFLRLEKESGGYDSDFAEFCCGVSILGRPDNPYSVANTVRSLLDKAASRGLDLSEAEKMLPPPVCTVSKISFETIRDELSAFDLPKTAAKALDALNQLLADFPNLARVEALPKFGQARKVKHLSDALAELKERFLTEAYYERHKGPFRAFARFLAAVAHRFREAKLARDCVDFGDQLLMARDLLRTGDFSDQFDWVIVDEVQDTSRVQCDVIGALWGPSTNLVVCGDRKQSIYAWRSADPDVMPDIERAMNDRGSCVPIPLKQSYRSKDRVLEAVNELFGNIYEDYESASLEPVESIGALTALGGEGPCVEFLAPDHDEDSSAEEMAAVARRIRLLVEGGPQWHPKFGHDGQAFVEGAPFDYGDILILLKRSTHQPVLEAALRKTGIPYTCGGKGKGFFERQEVRDLLLFLQVITEPFNDLALVGFMRSPLANVPDELIAEFGRDGDVFSHDILRKKFFESGSEAAERVIRYREAVGGKGASQLVREVIRETAYDAVLAGMDGGEQRLANMKKAIDWLRGVERGGQILLNDVVRLFEKYIQTPPQGAAEALLPDPAQDAVTIMTVHGAKGLTRRVCFVPDISFKDQADKGFAVFGRDTLELKLSGVAGEEVKTPGWAEARDADKAVRETESANVFYVAMTRARDLVVLSGAGTKKPDGWLKLAEGFLQKPESAVLKTWSFGELETVERPVHECRVAETTEPVCYKPLQVPPGLVRRPVTSLCKKEMSMGLPHSSLRNPASYGTLGHAVLEELAQKHWVGEIPALVELFNAEFEVFETERLIGELEAVRSRLRDETAGAKHFYTEWPFVLHRDGVLLDGSIDLLIEESRGWKIIDYKFSNETPELALLTYTPQLAAYREAVQKLNPGAEVSASLVLIGSDGARLVPFSTNGE